MEDDEDNATLNKPSAEHDIPLTTGLSQIGHFDMSNPGVAKTM